MEKITINYKHAGKRKNLILHNNADLDEAMPATKLNGADLFLFYY